MYSTTIWLYTWPQQGESPDNSTVPRKEYDELREKYHQLLERIEKLEKDTNLK